MASRRSGISRNDEGDEQQRPRDSSSNRNPRRSPTNEREPAASESEERQALNAAEEITGSMQGHDTSSTVDVSNIISQLRSAPLPSNDIATVNALLAASIQFSQVAALNQHVARTTASTPSTNSQNQWFGHQQYQENVQPFAHDQHVGMNQQLLLLIMNSLLHHLSQNLQQQSTSASPFGAAAAVPPAASTFLPGLPNSQLDAASLAVAALSASTTMDQAQQQLLLSAQMPVLFDSSTMAVASQPLNSQQQAQHHQIPKVAAAASIDAAAASSSASNNQRHREADPAGTSGNNLTVSTTTSSSGTKSAGSTDYKRIPCRARGLPSDHNSFSAYFTVPHNVRHGQDLICSYKPCRALGAKFAYCIHCGIPVAKRNFRQRHGHGIRRLKKSELRHMAEEEAWQAEEQQHHPQNLEAADLEDSKPAAKEDDKGSDSESVSASSSAGSSTDMRRKMVDNVSHAAGKAARRYAEIKEPSQQDGLEHAGKGQAEAAAVPRPRNPNAVWVRGAVSEERERQWAEMIYARPSMSNREEMSQWLLDVLQVSDPVTALPSASSPEDSTTDSGNGSSSFNQATSSSTHQGSDAPTHASASEDNDSPKTDTVAGTEGSNNGNEKKGSDNGTTSPNDSSSSQPNDRSTRNSDVVDSEASAKRRASNTNTDDDVRDDDGEPAMKHRRTNDVKEGKAPNPDARNM